MKKISYHIKAPCMHAHKLLNSRSLKITHKIHRLRTGSTIDLTVHRWSLEFDIAH
jgi:hypothetical protein